MSAELSIDDPSFGTVSRLGRRLAHELNNPISAIASSAYLIQDIIASGDGQFAASEIEPFVKSIQEECNALKATVEEYAKFVTTSSVLKNRIDLAEFVQKRAEEMAREGLPVTSSVANEKVFVDADVAGLGFVLRAITDSAISAGATQIMIMLESGEHCEIIVNDNRAALHSPDELLSAFSSDDRAHERSKHRVKGLGLKLPLAKRIVELHGGSIEIPAQKANLTEIHIRLPRINNAQAA